MGVRAPKSLKDRHPRLNHLRGNFNVLALHLRSAHCAALVRQHLGFGRIILRCCLFPGCVGLSRIILERTGMCSQVYNRPLPVGYRFSRGPQTEDGMKIGFIGLGRMGHHVASNLLKAGHSVTVWNRSQEPVQALVAKGAGAARTPEDALKGDAVFSMLSNDAVMRELGLDGALLERAAKGLIHVNLATISVAFAKELAAAHDKAGLAYISAPVFGRPEMAETAQLVLVAGGDTG